MHLALRLACTASPAHCVKGSGAAAANAHGKHMTSMTSDRGSLMRHPECHVRELLMGKRGGES